MILDLCKGKISLPRTFWIFGVAIWLFLSFGLSPFIKLLLSINSIEPSITVVGVMAVYLIYTCSDSGEDLQGVLRDVKRKDGTLRTVNATGKHCERFHFAPPCVIGSGSDICLPQSGNSRKAGANFITNAEGNLI